MTNKTIWYFSQELELITETDDVDVAQALLDFENRHGHTACATHNKGKHQVYSSRIK
jgi:hypothetical protein